MRLSNLALFLDATSTLRLTGSKEVVVEGCAIDIAKDNPLPVEIVEAGGDLHMAGNRLSLGTGGTGGFPDLDKLVLVIRAQPPRINLVDNYIGGILSFFGLPAPPLLDAAWSRQLLEDLRKNALDLRRGPNLRLARNTIGILRASRETLASLQGALGERPAGFSSASLTDNIFLIGGNQLVAGEATLSGNFIEPSGFPLNLVVAHAAYYAGNQGGTQPSPILKPGQAVIVNVAPRTNGATRKDLNSITIAEP